MENTKIEIASVEIASETAHEDQRRELNDLELVLVGGGNGDTILH